MDDKTEQLRDIFLDVTDEETVTERQTEERGSLTANQADVDDRLSGVIEQLREKFEITTPLEDETLCLLVREFYAGTDDDTLAEMFGCSSATVFEARMALHLIRDCEHPDERLEATVREHGDTGVIRLTSAETKRLAEEFDMDVSTVENTAAVIRADTRSRRVSHRFRTAFEEILTDADLTVQFTADAHDDGLRDATDGAEVDVDF